VVIRVGIQANKGDNQSDIEDRLSEMACHEYQRRHGGRRKVWTGYWRDEGAWRGAQHYVTSLCGAPPSGVIGASLLAEVHATVTYKEER